MQARDENLVPNRVRKQPDFSIQSCNVVFCNNTGNSAENVEVGGSLGARNVAGSDPMRGAPACQQELKKPLFTNLKKNLNEDDDPYLSDVSESL